MLALTAATAGAFAGCHPTGTPVVDPIETAAFAATFTMLASRASRASWLVVGVVSVAMSRSWMLIPAVAVVFVGFIAAFAERSRQRVGALVGALAVQVVLRWSPAVFHGFPSLVAFALVVLLAFSARRRVSSSTRRRALLTVAALGGVAIILSLPAVIGALLERTQVLAAEQAARSALSTVGGTASGSAAAQLRTASTDARSAAGPVAWWVSAGVRLVPVVAQQDRFLAGTLLTAASSASVGAREAPAIDYHRLGYHHGQIDLHRVAAIEQPMEALDRALVASSRTVRGLDTPWLLSPLQRPGQAFSDDITRAARDAALAVQTGRLLPALLGGDGTRHYFVAFMTPAESRGLDGILAAYGELTVTDGRVRMTASGSVDDLETGGVPPAQRVLTGPKDFLLRYGRFHPAEYSQDATYSPDLPTVDQVISQLYPQEGGTAIDGVLALDPYGLAALLRITGPISLPGLSYPLTAANAAEFLLKGEYVTFNSPANNNARLDFLQDALQVAFQKLVGGSLPSPRSLAQDLDPAVQDGRLAFWSNHTDEQPLLESLGLDDAFPQAKGGDVLAVTTQNQGNNKLDAYLRTSVSAHIGYNAATGAVRSTVTITLENTAPSTGLSSYVLDSPDDPGVGAGTNRTWLTLYSPFNVQSATIDGRRTGVTSDPELGVNAFSMYATVPSQSSVQVVIALVGRLDPRPTLPVSVRVQPDANPQRVRVDVAPLGESVLIGSSQDEQWVLSERTDQERSFRFSVA